MQAMSLPDEVDQTVALALQEDVGSGDLTSGLIASSARCHAEVIARESAVLCGTLWFERVFSQLDKAVAVNWLAPEGAQVAADQRVCTVSGPTRAILTGERTALNFLQTLSGTATLARRFAEAVAGLPVRLLDTRKTLPGLRQAQKYAVRCGGCSNHRMGLYDAVLLKENHIGALGGVRSAVALARRECPSGVPVEVEVENLDELDEALAAGADLILLDNFDLETLREAVTRTARRAQLEASGGVTLENLRRIAQTGVDAISIGALTKDARAVDYSLRLIAE